MPAATCAAPAPQLDPDDLLALAKAAHRHGVAGGCGTWAEYVKAKAPWMKMQDPARHSNEVLAGFVDSLAAEGAGDRFRRRFLRWKRHRRKEAEFVASGGGASGTAPAEGSGGASGPNTVWSLVRRTLCHSRYGASYSLPSYMPGWAATRRVLPCADEDSRPSGDAADAAGAGAGSAGGSPLPGPHPRLLGLDCEMVGTDGERDALAGVCVVDERGAVVYKVLVRPKGSITDYRTHLTGLTAADFEGGGSDVVSLKQARRAVQRLLTPQPQPPSEACPAAGAGDAGGAVAGGSKGHGHGGSGGEPGAKRAKKRRGVATGANGDGEDAADSDDCQDVAADGSAGPTVPVVPVVLVGHALHHDLAALRLDHWPVIDTALIYSFRSLPGCTPSLKDLAKAVLGVDIRQQQQPGPDAAATAGGAAKAGGGAGSGGVTASPASAGVRPHDMEEDAGVAVALAVHELRQPTPTPPLEPPEVHVPKEDLRKLMVHGLPKGTTSEQIAGMFAAAAAAAARPTLGGPASAAPGAKTAAAPSPEAAAAGAAAAAAKDAGGSQKHATAALVPGEVELQPCGKRAYAVFAHAGMANEAFRRLPGPASQDSHGRAVKDVRLQGGTAGPVVKVRKMACHNGLAFQAVAAAPPGKAAQHQQRQQGRKGGSSRDKKGRGGGKATRRGARSNGAGAKKG